MYYIDNCPLVSDKFKRKCLQAHDENILSIYLFSSCASGNLEEVKYILLSPDLLIHPNIASSDNYALFQACQKGHVDVVKFLLTSPELSVYCNVHAHKDHAFKISVLNNISELTEYFIFEFGLKKNIEVTNFLKEKERFDILGLFDSRHLYQSLEKELNMKNLKTIQDIKVKI